MANKIILKKTSTASKVPLSSDLEIGEIAVNLADQKLYSKNASGTVILVGSGISGAGDVVGPSSSTDNALARFDSTTGKVIQNGIVTQDDNGTLANVNAISFDTTPTSAPTTQGSMAWDSGNGTPSIVLNNDVSLQLGQEQLALVYNGTGSTITNGSVVAVTGAQGQRPSVSLADADSESTSANTLGIATQDIANGAEGFITTFGFVRGINTSAFTAGQAIYLSQTAGQFTATRPSAPAHTVALGWVIKVNASSGEVFVNINNGWELDELHNVLITSPTSGNTLIYDAVAGVWENASISAGTGISVTNGAGSISIANTGVTSVSGTAPIASSGGATPTISISQASSTTNGYLSSTDWNTFNNKTSNTGTVTSVTGGSYLTGGTITTSGTLAVDATSANTASKVVARDASGNFSAGTITATLNGNASTATTATNAGNADTLDGQHGSYYQPASTAITTSNIGSQSVNYATSAGSSTTVSATGATNLYSPNGSTVVSGDASTALPSTANSLIHTLGTGPSGNDGHILGMTWTGTGSYGAQIWIDTDPTNTMAIRSRSSGGVWNSWTSVITALNIGSQSVNYATTAGSANAVASGVVAGKMIYNSFTATASQTTFTTTNTYTSGKIDVYANGIRMVNGSDVTVTSGTSVVFASGLAVGTRVDLVYPI